MVTIPVPLAETGSVDNEHTNRRKVWDKAFSMQSLKDYQDVLEIRVRQLLDKLNGFARAKKAVDLHDWLGFFVWDGTYTAIQLQNANVLHHHNWAVAVMTDLAYSGGGQMLATGRDVDQSIEALCSSLHYAGINKVMPWITPITERLPWYPERKVFRDIATDLFRRRLEKGAESEHRDVFYHLVSNIRAFFA